jgi:dephospho-CoA kinase
MQLELSTKLQRTIALTGGIASGKSLVEAYLKSLGIPVEDADAVVHRLLRDDETLKSRIRAAFGPEVFTVEGAVDRVQLGRVVFQNPERRALLESWLHPAVRQELAAFRERHPNAPVVVVSIPLLFESKLENLYPEVWLLVCDPTSQIERLATYRGMSREDALVRIQSQMPLSEKQARLVTHPNGKTLINQSTPEALYTQIDTMLA